MWVGEGETVPVACELSEPESVRACVDEVKKRELRLDAIIDVDQFPLVYLPGVLVAFERVTFAPIRPCVARMLERLGFDVNDEDDDAMRGTRGGDRATVRFDRGRITSCEVDASPPE